MKRFLTFLMTLCMVMGLFAGCGSDATPEGSQGDPTESTDASAPTAAAPAQVDFSKNDADMFSDRDLEVGYDEDNAVVISLQGSTATATSETVKIQGSTVTVTAEATYILRGELQGTLIVKAEEKDKLQLVFDGAKISSATCAALYILEADKVFLTTTQGSENILENGGSFEAIDENNIDGALFSKQDLTLNGQGKLTVTSPAGHGIVCKDDLVITSGSYTVSAASHGLDANDSIRIASADITVTAGKDALHAENEEDTEKGFVYLSSGNLNLEAEGDGVSAGAYGQFENGTVSILAGGGSVNGNKASSGNYGGFGGGPGGFGGGPGGMGGMGRPGSQTTTTTEQTDSTSMKGIKAAGSLLFSDGSYTIDSADDAVHANISVTVNGGSFSIATGDDALHAEDTLTVTGGNVDISKSYEGLESLHIAVSGGQIRLVASDDGLNAAGGTDSSGFTGGRDGMFGGGPGGRPGGMGGNSNGSITISGGDLYINSSGDGLDANGTLQISGGHTIVTGPTQGDTATLDYDISGTVTGGTFIGTGASGMAQSFSSATQGLVALRMGNQSAGTQITLTDSSGNILISHTPELGFQVVILTCPEMVSGESYSLTVGSLTETVTAS